MTDPVFRFHPEDFQENNVKRPAILREYNIYKPILTQTLSPMELNQIEILVNEMKIITAQCIRHFTLKENQFGFWLYLTSFSLKE